MLETSVPSLVMGDPWMESLKDVLTELSTPFLISLYVGGADLPAYPYESIFEEIFKHELESELFSSRDVRGDIKSGFWHLNSLTDEDLDELEDYFEEILPNYLERWVEGIAAVKAQRAGQAVATAGNKLQLLNDGADPDDGSGVID